MTEAMDWDSWMWGLAAGLFLGAIIRDIADHLRRKEMTDETNPSHDPADMHWLIFRDETGWGCDGCDWTGKLDEFWEAHGTRRHDDNIPF